MDSEKRFVFWTNKKITVYLVLMMILLCFKQIIDSCKVIEAKNYIDKNPEIIRIMTLIFISITWYAIIVGLLKLTLSKYKLTKLYMSKGLLLKKITYWEDVRSIKLINNRNLLLSCNKNKLIAIKMNGINNDISKSIDFLNQIIYNLSEDQKSDCNIDTESTIQKMASGQTNIFTRFLENISLYKNTISIVSIIALLIIFSQNIINVVKHMSKILVFSSLEILELILIVVVLSILFIIIIRILKGKG